MSLLENLAENGGTVLTFKINEVVYAVDIQMVTDIIELPEITAVPLMPDYIKGVINQRGRVVPVVDMRERFGLEKINYDRKTCVIVLNVQEFSVGIIADRVIDTEKVRADEISKSLRKNSFVSHVITKNGEIRHLIDFDKVVG